MRTRFAVAIVVSLACLTAPALAQAPKTYQPGKIVSIKKRPAPPSHTPAGTEGQLAAETDSYDVKVSLGSNVYDCRYSAAHGAYVEWAEGKDVQARVKGKVLYIKKALEGEEKMRIAHVHKASTP